jgi:hypothetical protein
MKFLLFLGLAAGGIVAALPWVNASMDASGLRQDAAFAPLNACPNNAVTAGAIAQYLLRTAKERGAALTPEGLHIEVEAARQGTLSTQTASMLGQDGTTSLPTVSTQKATIQVQYDQPIYLGLTQHVEFTVEAKGMGEGGATAYPSGYGKEAGAPAE